MDLEHRFTVRYDEATVRAAVRAYVWRRIVLDNKLMWLTSAAMAGLAAYLIHQGDRSWLLGLFGATVALPFLLLAGGWRAHFQNTVGRFRRMKTPEARFALDDAGVTITAEDGAATINWPAIVEFWERPGAWMVFLAPNQFFLLPTAGVPAAALEFFRRKTNPAPAARGSAP